MSGLNGEEQRAMTDPTAECDLVMKGGITSGVVYPRAAGHLAERYRFRRLGGASAGAIAAAFVAAAEHGRIRGAFDALDGVPDELGSKLSTLFQPSPSTQPAFELLTAWIEPEWGLPRKALSTVAGIVRRAPAARAGRGPSPAQRPRLHHIALTLLTARGGCIRLASRSTTWIRPRTRRANATLL
jgi:Patatin-like phospholipase